MKNKFDPNLEPVCDTLLDDIINCRKLEYFLKIVLISVSGMTAILLILILSIPQLGAVEVGEALEWLFFIILPNYCFGISLQNVYVNYENKISCSSVEAISDLVNWCRVLATRNESNVCCPCK